MDGSSVIFAIGVSDGIGYYCSGVVGAMSISSVIGASKRYDSP